MSISRQRFITGPDSASGPRSQLEVGVQHALSLVNDGDTGLLMTFYGKQNIENVYPRLSATLGSRVASGLWEARDAPAGLRVVTERDSAPFVWRGPVLLVYPSAKMLSRVGEIRDVTAEIVVPWATSEPTSNWQAAWSPTGIGDAVTAIAKPVVSDVTVAGLKSLTNFVNLGNRLVTKSDREETIRVFETLLAFDDKFDIVAARAWLVSEGHWPGDVADEAAQICNDLASGKRLRGRSGPDRGSYDYWLKVASKSGPQ